MRICYECGRELKDEKKELKRKRANNQHGMGYGGMVVPFTVDRKTGYCQRTQP